MKNAIVFGLSEFIYRQKKLTRDTNISDEGRQDVSSKNRPYIEIGETVISTILLVERSSERDRETIKPEYNWRDAYFLRRPFIVSSCIYIEAWKTRK